MQASRMIKITGLYEALACCIFSIFPCRIDMKMSDTQGGYKLDEAQAILSEMKALKKAITSGEKEKQDLIQVLRQDGFIVFCVAIAIRLDF